MTKTLKTKSTKRLVKDPTLATVVVSDKKTGRTVTVKGVGALKGSELKLKKNVSLTKPIAKQALNQRSERRKAS